MTKDHLIFDTTDATSIKDSDSVGAFIRGADGSLITEHYIPGDTPSMLVTQGLILMARHEGTMGNAYTFTVVDTWVAGPTGPLSFTELTPGNIVLDLYGTTPTQAQVLAAIASSVYVYSEAGSPAGPIVVAPSQSFSGGKDTTIHRHLDTFSITAAGDGSPITHHHDTGGTTSLDVHITNPQVVAVNIDGIYDGVNNLLPANVGLIGSSRAVPGLANQTLQFTGAGIGSDNVVVANIVAQDVNAFGMVFDGSTWDRMPGNSTDGVTVKISNSSVAVTGTVELGVTTLAALESITVQNGAGVAAVNIQDGGNSITVDGSVTVSGTVELGSTTLTALENIGLNEDHNWGAVGSTTLRVAAEVGNASGMADFGNGVVSAQTLRVTMATDVPVTVNDAAQANIAMASQTRTLPVAATAAVAVASPLASRKYLWLYNFSNKQIFVGGASLTAANGFPVSPGSYMEMRAGAASPVYFVGQAGQTPEIRTLEAS
jgi:hypothetical protein